MKKLYESFIKRRSMQSIPEHHVNRGIGLRGYRIKRGVAKLLEKFIKFNTYGFAIRGHRIKRGVAKLLEKFIKFNTYGFAIRGYRIKRGVAL